VQTKKKNKIKKKYIKEKNKYSFRNKRTNIRKKSIKQYRKRIAKKKRKVYIKQGGGNNIYNENIYNLLKKFMSKKVVSTDNLSIDDEDKSELNFYNFDFILIDEKDNQQILDATMIENEFDEMEDINEGKKIDDSTKKFIEDGKEICKSQVYVVNGENPVAFTETCNDGQETDSWFKEIFNSI
jgi:hypothetical protein